MRGTPYFLPPILARFVQPRPNISVRIAEEITPVLLDHLHNGRVDFVLLARGDEFLCEELFREPLFACLPKRHRLAARRSINIGEIRSEPFLVLKEGHCFRDNALAACRRSKVHPHVVFESGQFSTILSLVAAGMGVSVVPAMAVAKQPGCRSVRLNDERTDVPRGLGATAAPLAFAGAARARG